MGYYINPPDVSKEEWLTTHGQPIDPPRDYKWDGDCLPVCLVNNGWMTAAGIAYSPREAEAFMHPDGRPKQWFMVSKADLKPYYSEA